MEAVTLWGVAAILEIYLVLQSSTRTKTVVLRTPEELDIRSALRLQRNLASKGASPPLCLASKLSQDRKPSYHIPMLYQ